jgi:hypothetical protein
MKKKGQTYHSARLASCAPNSDAHSRRRLARRISKSGRFKKAAGEASGVQDELEQ